MRLNNILLLTIIIIVSLPRCTTKQSPKVIAHRGGANLAPENTLAAFRNAIDLGVDMIEIDVEQTSDSVVVVLHDDWVNRCRIGNLYMDS